MRVTTLLLLPLLAIAGCAAESRLEPVSTANAGSAATEPEPPNSLPRGSSVMAPLTTSVGNVGTTRVGPATAARVGVGRNTY